MLKYVHQADDLTHFTSLPMRERQTCMTELWPTYIFLSQKSQGRRFAKYLSWTVKKKKTLLTTQQKRKGLKSISKNVVPTHTQQIVGKCWFLG